MNISQHTQLCIVSERSIQPANGMIGDPSPWSECGWILLAMSLPTHHSKPADRTRPLPLPCVHCYPFTVDLTHLGYTSRADRHYYSDF